MDRITYDSIVRLQDIWKELNMPDWERDGMISVTNILMHKMIDNGHKLDGIEILYPEECECYSVFLNVAYALNAYVTPLRNSDRAKMHNIGLKPDKIPE